MGKNRPEEKKGVEAALSTDLLMRGARNIPRGSCDAEFHELDVTLPMHGVAYLRSGICTSLSYVQLSNFILHPFSPTWRRTIIDHPHAITSSALRFSMDRFPRLNNISF